MEVVRTINTSFFLRKEPLPVYSLNPYLSEDDIGRNIKFTLEEVPVKISPHFKPINIDWKPADGNNELIKKTIKILIEEIN